MKRFCLKCGKTSHKFTGKPFCSCGGILTMEPDFKYQDGTYASNYPYLDEIVSLGETETPIVNIGDLMLKLEYFSPTYSYKDRGTKSLISWLKGNLAEGSSINEDSSGNAGASIAGYGAAAGFEVNIFVPEKTVPAKIKQIEQYGAIIHRVKGTREDVSNAAANAAGYLASHVYNPEFRDGMRQISYEIFKQTNGRMPDSIYMPVSAGTLLLGVISGLKHLQDSGEIPKIPHIVAVQTEAVSPLCSRINATPYDPKRQTTSIADALVSKEPPLLSIMENAIREYGSCISVSESEIIESHEQLSRKGFLVEYSSATVYAAYKKRENSGKSLLIMTGNGLKNL